MNSDLVISDYFSVPLQDGQTIGQTGQAGHCKTAQEVKAYGVWSMTIVFHILTRIFLSRFVLDDEMSRLLVKQQMCTSWYNLAYN